MAKQSSGTAPTLGHIIKSLTAAQAWAVLVAIATVLGGAFTLGRYFTDLEKKLPSNGGAAETIPVPCYKAKDWPKGVWLVWGHFDNNWKPISDDDKFPQLATKVRFDSSTTYVAQGNRKMTDLNKNENEFHATVNPAMQAGAVISARGQDGSGYTSKMPSGRVSSDGCMVTGDFDDSDGNHGSLTYLYERSRYYVDPNE